MSEDSNGNGAKLEKVDVATFAKTLPPNSKVRIVFSKESGGLMVNTQIIRHEEDTFLVIGAQDTRIVLDTFVQVSFATSKALYSFVTKLMRTEFNEEFAFQTQFVLKRPVAWQRTQRRENFRLELNTEIALKSVGQEDKHYKGKTINISASGILLYLEDKLEMGKQFDLKYTIDGEGVDHQTYIIKSELARIVENEDPDKSKRYTYGFKFLDLSEKDQDRLSKSLWDIVKYRGVM